MDIQKLPSGCGEKRVVREESDLPTIKKAASTSTSGVESSDAEEVHRRSAERKSERPRKRRKLGSRSFAGGNERNPDTEDGSVNNLSSSSSDSSDELTVELQSEDTPGSKGAIDVQLTDRDLWKTFHDTSNEMTVTKPGR